MRSPFRVFDLFDVLMNAYDALCYYNTKRIVDIMNALLSMIKPALMFLIISLMLILIIYVVSTVHNKKKNIERFTKTQRSCFKYAFVVGILSVLLLFMNFSVFVDMCKQQTENEIGTVTAITTSYKLSYCKITISTAEGEYDLVCSKNHFINKYDFNIGDVYQFEYYVHSKTISEAVLIEN